MSEINLDSTVGVSMWGAWLFGLYLYYLVTAAFGGERTSPLGFPRLSADSD